MDDNLTVYRRLEGVFGALVTSDRDVEKLAIDLNVPKEALYFEPSVCGLVAAIFSSTLMANTSSSSGTSDNKDISCFAGSGRALGIENPPDSRNSESQQGNPKSRKVIADIK